MYGAAPPRHQHAIYFVTQCTDLLSMARDWNECVILCVLRYDAQFLTLKFSVYVLMFFF